MKTNILQRISLVYLILVFSSLSCLAVGVTLTSEERQYILDHPILNVANEKDWPPFDFMENGQPQGYSIDVIHLVAEKIGVELKFVNDLTWGELLQEFRNGNIDVMPALYKNPERESYMSFTQPYYAHPSVIVVKDDNTRIDSFNDLKGKRVAVIPDFMITSTLAEHHPSINRIEVSGVLEGLKAVAIGEADAFIESFGVISWIMKNNYIPNLRFIANVDIEGLKSPALHMSVARDQTLLRDILQKGLDAISEEELSEFRHGWIGLEMGSAQTEDVWATAWQVIWVGFFIFLGLMAMLHIINKLLREDRMVLPFGSLRFRRLMIIVLSFFIALITLLGWLSMKHNKDKTLAELQSTLEMINRTAAEHIELWVSQRLSSISIQSKDDHLLRISEDLKRSSGPNLIDALHYQRLDDFLRIRWGEEGLEDFFILDTSGTYLYSFTTSLVGKQIDQNEPVWSNFADSREGVSIYVPPIQVDTEGMLGSGISFLAPLVNSQDQVVAILGNRVDLKQSFSQLLKLTRTRGTDETYAFDKNAYFLSESRFPEALYRAGLVDSLQSSIYNVVLHDPGKSLLNKTSLTQEIKHLPLTKMATLALKGVSNYENIIYRNYLGTEVLGAWIWLDHLGLGLATEIELEEALDTYFTMRNTVQGVLAITVFLSVLSTLFVLGLGERSNLVLSKAKDTLEIRVKERTAELNTKKRDLEKAYAIIKDQKDRMEGELNVAHDIQMSMLPLIFPPFPERVELDIHAVLKPAREVGGDFYDFYFIDKDTFCFCIGDVSGKGVPAALFMAVTKTLIKSGASATQTTAGILNHVNAELSRDNSSSMFVTLFIGILNVQTGEMNYTNAGHNPPFIKKGTDGSLRRVDERHGPILGAVEGLEYGEDTCTLDPGDLVILYTDGVTEAMDPNQKLYSEEKLVADLEAQSFQTASHLVDSISHAVDDFAGTAEQADDITILSFVYSGDESSHSQNPQIIKIQNNLDEILKVQDGISSLLQSRKIPKKTFQNIKIVVDELISNIIKYAYTDEDEHEIEILISLGDNSLQLEISDDGIPFDQVQAAPKIDKDQSIDERQIGGLGIHLVKKLVDEMEYQRTAGKNIIRILKKI
ncbi:MAG: SpoIIE family protein phosphatase [Candidatus Marinimicrobia bacterium]|nr:SpoIIE family protein phosphatase [Candidatus Neomarinimicrobiota bacterium]MBT3576557.1 SpoIIE family protein phosphatase [Candidatus Neomarinimicrobiota bacterium]MBT3680117.1 SpoIIE family protein phosphatase [Candidatus Neomarinimicrobiota bacterium]MBT3951324.1 SpoIIE family protein phosphatase [Candidatus Neomarinimicrobiota bacterium]MBT4253069.1 SpoIIE family protein phosphatase [Candidatus Neomarinimicrobiota bacterium]